MRLLINEWLLHDLRGDNGREAQKEGLIFLQTLIVKQDRIVILYNSPWMTKAFSLMSATDPVTRQLSRYLRNSVILNTDRCHILYPSELKPIPQNLQDLIAAGQIDDDDDYLLQIYYSTEIDLFVTTDARLQEALLQIADIKIKLRDDFLNEYLRMTQ